MFTEYQSHMAMQMLRQKQPHLQKRQNHLAEPEKISLVNLTEDR